MTVASDPVEELRARHGVRPIDKEEEGLPTASLPPGVYGFTYSPGLDETPLFPRKSYHSFEVHKLADHSEQLVGFVTSQDAELFREGKSGAEFKLYPDPWEDASMLIVVPADRVAKLKRVMSREAGNPFRARLT